MDSVQGLPHTSILGVLLLGTAAIVAAVDAVVLGLLLSLTFHDLYVSGAQSSIYKCGWQGQ